MTLGYTRVLGWHGGQERLELPDEPTEVKTNFECSLHLELLTGVCAMGVGGGTLGRAPSDELLDKFTRLSGFSSFTECNKGGWTLDISEGYDTRSVDAAMRVQMPCIGLEGVARAGLHHHGS
jgi:hypothetical protein